MQEVYDYLKNAGFYYLATVDGDKPKVRPFGTYLIYNDKFYIQTGKVKPVAQQMLANPNIEICAFNPGEGTWLRLAAEAIEDPDEGAQAALLNDYPQLQDRYAVGDGNLIVLALKNATATFENHGGVFKTVTF